MKIQDFILATGSSLVGLTVGITAMQVAILTKEFAVAYFKLMDFSATSNLYFYASVGSAFTVLTLVMMAFRFFECAVDYYNGKEHHRSLGGLFFERIF